MLRKEAVHRPARAVRMGAIIARMRRFGQLTFGVRLTEPIDKVWHNGSVGRQLPADRPLLFGKRSSNWLMRSIKYNPHHRMTAFL